MAADNQFVIITGMSGAGKTVAMQSFEDLGYFCVDNMPPSLLPKFKELIREQRDIDKVALVVDLRSKAFYDEVIEMFSELTSKYDASTNIIFLDASDNKLVSRYKETRRAHPLAREGRIIDGIKLERKLLANVKKVADLVLDTTNMSPRELREEIFHNFESVDTNNTFHVEVMSFGFKYGLPLDADIVMDVRFLPNPYYDPVMRKETGLDKDVSNYVLKSKGAEEFYQHFYNLIKSTLPAYEEEGKASLTVAIGCTGGQHRSVAIAQKLGEDLSHDFKVNITHRDVSRYIKEEEN